MMYDPDRNLLCEGDDEVMQYDNEVNEVEHKTKDADARQEEKIRNSIATIMWQDMCLDRRILI
ncbi:conserved hypothetical protein [Ricinus communis]|uniref:Uncharacterized protein n=1 Tax=Ricinus communis TaxID=3988 RepID=B9SP40_RICCO|nr:conserved hypothetical protein [Ricinus communis]